MEYWVLTQEDNFLNLIGEEHIKSQVNIDSLMISTESAVAWLLTNNERKLIITMPMQESQRKQIAQILSIYDDRCIALEPAQILTGSRHEFSHYYTIEITLIKQLKDLTEEVISA